MQQLEGWFKKERAEALPYLVGDLLVQYIGEQVLLIKLERGGLKLSCS